ncbi:MAG TPA: hypothetical protein VI197_16185 [Polyangiaceae bacterium]
MLDDFDSFGGAEFPHDNPELFSGPGWLAVDPCGGPRAIAWASRRDLHYPAPAAPEVPADRAVPPAPVAVAVGPLTLTDFDRLLLAVRAVLPSQAEPELAVELERFLRGDDVRANAWRRLLSGQSSDLTECGDRPLDEWVSDLVGARLGSDAAAIAALRRALRKRGVAAFGMLAA